MKVIVAVIAAATGVAGPIQLCAQDVFPDVEYIQGRTGLSDKMKGKLVIGSAGVEFRTKSDSSVFAVPLETIKDVTNSLTSDPGSFGRKMLLGVFSARREEFLYLSTETPERAEAIVFKCHKKNTSPDMMAKIKFQMAKAKPVAADSTKP